MQSSCLASPNSARFWAKALVRLGSMETLAPWYFMDSETFLARRRMTSQVWECWCGCGSFPFCGLRQVILWARSREGFSSNSEQLTAIQLVGRRLSTPDLIPNRCIGMYSSVTYLISPHIYLEACWWQKTFYHNWLVNPQSNHYQKSWSLAA